MIVAIGEASHCHQSEGKYIIASKLIEDHADFRSSGSYNGQIFAMRNAIEQSLEFQQLLTQNFVDFKKAFDCVNREPL